MADRCAVYWPRKPHLTPLYQCVQDHYEASKDGKEQKSYEAL